MSSWKITEESLEPDRRITPLSSVRPCVPVWIVLDGCIPGSPKVPNITGLFPDELPDPLDPLDPLLSTLNLLSEGAEAEFPSESIHWMFQR